MAQLLIVYQLPNGEEREEMWSSVAAFRAWAETRHQRLHYRAFAADDDGEWYLMEKGRIAGSTVGDLP